MGAPEEYFPGGNDLSTVSFLGPLTLHEMLSTYSTLSERTVAHAHDLARRLLENITEIPDLERCKIQVFRRPGPNPKQELSGGLGFHFSERCEPIDGLPQIEDLPTVAKVHVYRIIPGDIGQVYEMEEFTSDEGDEVARTGDSIVTACRRRGLELAPDLTTLAGEQPDQLIIDTVDFGRQRL